MADKCIKCGSGLPDAAIFCPACGTSVSARPNEFQSSGYHASPVRPDYERPHHAAGDYAGGGYAGAGYARPHHSAAGLSPLAAMVLPLKRYADFEGRSTRMEYWMFTLLWWINPGYIGKFFEDERLMVAGTGGIIWMSIGAFIMAKMVSFEI